MTLLVVVIERSRALVGTQVAAHYVSVIMGVNLKINWFACGIDFGLMTCLAGEHYIVALRQSLHGPAAMQQAVKRQRFFPAR